jgi:hypothetical protein
MSTTAIGRPISVSFIAIIGFIEGIIAIAAGLGLIVERNDANLLEHINRSSSTLTTYGVASIIWGALALLVAYGLWHGAGWARILVAILQVLALFGGILLLFSWDGHYLWQGIWQIIVSLIVLWILFNPRADEFFQGRAA